MLNSFLLKIHQYNDANTRSNIHIDVLWCMFTIAVTAIGAYYVRHSMVAGSDLDYMSMWAGVLHGVIYLQALTLIVMALSYIFKWVHDYRALIMIMLPLIIYLIIKLYTYPDPVAPMYSYSVGITIIVAACFKIKEFIFFLLSTIDLEKHLVNEAN